MKKIFLLAVSFFFAFPGLNSHAESLDKGDVEFEQNIEEIQNSLSNLDLEIDLAGTETKVEETLKNKDGKSIGTFGIERVETNNSFQNGISLLSTTLTPGKTYTFKVYWYAASVNYQFYTDVTVVKSTGLGKIVDAYDPWYLVIPPGVVSSDTLSIIRKNETSTKPAEARYTLKLSAPVSTSLYIYGRVQDGKFKSGGN